ncbi:MAG: uncharacterized protein K0S01_2637 [Herbinix sp.]|jgi:glycosyltransferase involved in cell wall biosynthesis|nr:uncharacterized protein [Herbinix sp.]
MHDKKTVLYIGNFAFPFGNASGKRVYANGKILRELGYEVLFVGTGKAVSDLELLKNTQDVYDGFNYYNISYPKSNLDWIKYKKTFNDIELFLKNKEIINDLCLIIYYGSPRLSIFNMMLINFSHANKIKILSDCVDWLTPKTNNVIFNIIKWIDNTYQKAYANKKTDGIIAISNYLSNYYKKSGLKTIIIPPLSPVKFKCSESSYNFQHKKIITYAGQPFRIGKKVTDLKTLKDRIDKTIILLHAAKVKGCVFIFNIYGFTKDEYLYTIPSQGKYIDELGDSICFHGLAPNEEVMESIVNSDFTILIRDVKRDTMAGFPTKVSESISCGTPVITTRTSDLEDYISEGENGFFIDFDEEKSLEELKNILSIDQKKVLEIKKNCIESQMFYYKNYENKLKDFLSLLNYQ